MIQRMDHCALGVSDLPRSLAFYRDVLGLQVSLELDITDDRMERLTGVPGARCRIVHLKSDQVVLELFQYYSPAGSRPRSELRQCDLGLIHIGFRVSDIDRHIAVLKEHGLTPLGEKVRIRPGVEVVYFRGPDGEVLELREIR